MPIKKLPYIYANLFPVLWKSISNALKLCVEYKINRQEELLTETNPKLIQCFETIVKSNPLPDRQITEGLYRAHQERESQYPRVLKLVLKAFEDAQKIKASEAFLIPSPLNIIYHLFIAPEHSFTAAYSISACKSFLFNLMEMKATINAETISTEGRVFTEFQINDALADFAKFIEQNGRWPKINASELQSGKDCLRVPEIQNFVGHFLALKGIAHLWFGPIKEKYQEEGKTKYRVIKTSEKLVFDFLTFDNKKEFHVQLRKKMLDVKFRKSARYSELPEWSEITNQLFGFPIPIKGADVVFYGGLKPSSIGGLVISISGRAGVGKTSLALSLADSFSPFGTQCFYISLEEEIVDIKRRLVSLRPHLQQDLSFFPSKISWFYGKKYPGTVKIESFSEELSILAADLKSVLVRSDACFENSTYIIIIDNITELVSDYKIDQYAKIERFVEECRNFNAIVILLSPEDIPKKFNLEYLVDIGIELKHKGINEEDQKPIRVFNLYKTRHQLSRQGSHIFHMSGTEGFRISPQITSQIDRKEKIQRQLQDETKLIHTVNYLEKKSNIMDAKINSFEIHPIINETSSSRFFLNIYPRTHILVHGYGSAGKAGFALKILLTPPVDITLTFDQILRKKFNHLKFQRKILIISFLYPQKYYHELVYEKKKIHKKICQLFQDLPDPILEYLELYPGYLTPQDFLNKVTRKLDEGDLLGQPFTGVLIDGLHNVFLQFEKLQDSNMVWPMLYNILSRYNLTVISTFTNFSLNDKLIDFNFTEKNQLLHQSVPDHLLLQKGMAPFLHALVKASDYYLFMEQLTSSNDGTKRYLMAVKGAISQAVPEGFLEWDRENNIFLAKHTLPELKNWLKVSKVE